MELTEQILVERMIAIGFGPEARLHLQYTAELKRG